MYGLRSLVPALMSLVLDYSLSTAQAFTAATSAIIPNCMGFDLLNVLELVQRRRPSEFSLAAAGKLRERTICLV